MRHCFGGSGENGVEAEGAGDPSHGASESEPLYQLERSDLKKQKNNKKKSSYPEYTYTRLENL